MISGGFNNDNQPKSKHNSTKLNKGINAVGRGANKVGKKVGKGVLNGAKRGVKSAEKGIKSFLNPIRLILTFLVVLLCIGAFITYSYYATGEDDGETQQYIGERNKGDETDSGFKIKEYSNSNAACIAFYTLLSKDKSVWQEYKDEKGEITLIRPTDERAVSDYFSNDKSFFLEPDLLFCLNKYIFSEEYVYPEAFLKPVAYDENEYKLKDLVDESGKVVVTSPKYNSLKEQIDDKVENNVSEYGLASVLTYKKETKSTYLKGTYIKQDIVDENTLQKKTVSIEAIPYEYLIESEEVDILTNAITFAGEIKYNYEPANVKIADVTAGTSSNDHDNVNKILYKKETIRRYMARHNRSYYSIRYFKSVDDMLAYCETHDYSPVKNSNGDYVVYKKTFDLYRYRSELSGKYSSFVNLTSKDTNELGNKYLYDYLKNFCTYEPVVDRSYDPLKSMHSKANISGYSASLGGGGGDFELGEGTTRFERFYNGSAREVIERFWDALIQWGFTKEQAAAVMGNITIESSFNPLAINPTSGASGLCQWMNGRYTQLISFARNHNGKDWTDVISQIQFACMELDASHRYSFTSFQWICSDEYLNIWKDGKDVEEMAKVMALGWERFATQAQYEGKARHSVLSQKQIKDIVDERIKNADAAYSILADREVEYDIEVIPPIGENGDDGMAGNGKVPSSATMHMTKEDRETFSKFYHATDDDGESGMKYKFYSNALSTDQINNLLLRTNSYINGTSISEENLNTVEALWTSNYLTDLSDSKNYAETLDSISLAEASELSEYGFMLPVDLSGFKCFSDLFTPNRGWINSAHKGFDMACHAGTPIYAVSEGEVELSRYSSSAGNYIIINHGADAKGRVVKTVYMHNSELKVSVGQKVKKGDVIALAGTTGMSTGPHCHFEIRINDVHYNPVFAYELVKNGGGVSIKTTVKENGHAKEEVMPLPSLEFIKYIHSSPGNWPTTVIN